LRAFKHNFVVNCPIDRVWEFYTDIKHLDIITPREIDLKITNATSQKLVQGSEIWLEGRIIMMLHKRSRWHSVITTYSVSPQQCLYVDEMLTGPFKKWIHSHKFRSVDSNNNQKQTQVIDEIDFELPYGIIGRIFDGHAYRMLEKLFCNRKLATIRALENNT
jgi:ligand-binding SRPBCC domain-containing protein